MTDDELITKLDRLTPEEIKNRRTPPLIDADKGRGNIFHIHQPNEGDRIPQSVVADKSDMYIQQPNGADKMPPSGAVDKSSMHIQKPVSEWIPERERHDTILLQSLLTRSVEIVNASYSTFPELIEVYNSYEKSKNDKFTDALDARCTLVETITDRLFVYVKKKVQEKNERLTNDRSAD